MKMKTKKPWRRIWASREVSIIVRKSPNERLDVLGFFPCDRAGCECQKAIAKFKQELSQLSLEQRKELMASKKTLSCPNKNKKGLSKFKIVCANCGEIQGYCYASDKTLKDWCDFHYVQWTDGEQWFGCLTPHVSPVTQELCLECCCGQDTRDFRPNMTLSSKVVDKLEKINQVGRAFGQKNSKFLVKKVK